LVSYACLCKGSYEDPARLPEEYEGGKRLSFIREMAASKGVNPSALVIAWLTNLHRCEGFPRVIPLFSATPKQMKQNLRGLSLSLSDEELAEMNAVTLDGVNSTVAEIFNPEKLAVSAVFKEGKESDVRAAFLNAIK